MTSEGVEEKTSWEGMLKNNGVWRWGSLQDEGDVARGNRSSPSRTFLPPTLSLLFGALSFLCLVSLVPLILPTDFQSHYLER